MAFSWSDEMFDDFFSDPFFRYVRLHSERTNSNATFIDFSPQWLSRQGNNGIRPSRTASNTRTTLRRQKTKRKTRKRHRKGQEKSRTFHNHVTMYTQRGERDWMTMMDPFKRMNDLMKAKKMQKNKLIIIIWVGFSRTCLRTIPMHTASLLRHFSPIPKQIKESQKYMRPPLRLEKLPEG